MSAKRELRFTANAEVRASASDAGQSIEGYASTFGREAVISNLFREVVQKGAFAKSIRDKDDVKFLFNHNSDFVGGRVANGSLQLGEDSKGLHFKAKLPDTSSARELYSLCRDNYVNECSFAFAPRTNGQRFVDPMDAWVGDDPDDHDPDDADCECEMCRSKLPLRVLSDLALYDVSAVVSPAYGGTSCEPASAGARTKMMFPEGVPEEILSHRRCSWNDADRLRWFLSVENELRGRSEKVQNLIDDLEMADLIAEGRKAIENSVSLEAMAARNAGVISREQHREKVVEPTFVRYRGA